MESMEPVWNHHGYPQNPKHFHDFTECNCECHGHAGCREFLFVERKAAQQRQCSCRDQEYCGFKMYVKGRSVASSISSRCFVRAGNKVQRRTCAVTNMATAEPQTPPAEKASKENARPIFYRNCRARGNEAALYLNVIDPTVGGVMLIGDRGHGKSTTARVLVDLLPGIKVVSGDPLNSDPEDLELMSEDVRKRVSIRERFSVMSTKINMVDLPLGPAEDRVCGNIDMESLSLNKCHLESSGGNVTWRKQNAPLGKAL